MDLVGGDAESAPVARELEHECPEPALSELPRHYQFRHGQAVHVCLILVLVSFGRALYIIYPLLFFVTFRTMCAGDFDDGRGHMGPIHAHERRLCSWFLYWLIRRKVGFWGVNGLGWGRSGVCVGMLGFRVYI